MSHENDSKHYTILSIDNTKIEKKMQSYTKIKKKSPDKQVKHGNRQLFFAEDIYHEIYIPKCVANKMSECNTIYL